MNPSILKIAVVLKKVQESEPLNNSYTNKYLRSLLTEFEDEIVVYFNGNNKSINKSFTDLYDTIYKLKLISNFLIIGENVISEITQEDWINNNIIEIHQKDFSKELNIGLIKSLETFRDYNNLHLIKHLTIKDVSAFLNDPIVSDNIRKSNFHELVYNNIYSNEEKKEAEKFKEFLFDALSVEYGGILYYLCDEKRLNFKNKTLDELALFCNNAFGRYQNRMSNFKLVSNSDNLASYFQKHVDDVRVFVLKSRVEESIGVGIFKALNDIYDLRELEAGWDDEESKPINYSSIQMGISIVSNIFMNYLKVPSFIAPTAYSGVLLEYSGNNDRVDIRIGDVGDSEVIINYMRNNELVNERVHFSYEFLNILWNKDQKK